MIPTQEQQQLVEKAVKPFYKFRWSLTSGQTLSFWKPVPLFGIPWSWTVGRAPKNARTENIFCYSGYKFKEKSQNELLSSKGNEKNSSSSIPSLLAENGAINPLPSYFVSDCNLCLSPGPKSEMLPLFVYRSPPCLSRPPFSTPSFRCPSYCDLSIFVWRRLKRITGM